MNINIVCVSRNKEVVDAISRNRFNFTKRETDSISALEKKNITLELNTYWANKPNARQGLEKFFLRFARRDAALIVLWDSTAQGISSSFRGTIFSRQFDGSKVYSNAHNYLKSIIMRYLREFAYVFQKFESARGQDALLLPFRNFEAVERDGLFSLFECEHISNDYFEKLDESLKYLSRRKRPKRRSRYKQRYFVDDRLLYFTLGKEKHGQAETKRPPHNELCELSKFLRHGVRYDLDRHFNVSNEDSRIQKPQLQDCHGDSYEIEAATHLNIFPNDFIR